ncbi:aspartic peptidase domain-containing protein [Mycena olivaceomarginata]|nr:aspartic peptidase domain-containing protein [Mycena olivaceomarginata]
MRALVVSAICAFLLSLQLAWAEPTVIPIFRRGNAPWTANHDDVTRGSTLPHSISPRYKLRRTLADELDLSNQDDDSYFYASVEIGNPPKTLPLALDLVSADLLIATQAASCQLNCPRGSPFYDPSGSLDSVNKSTSGSLSTIQLAGDTIQGYVFDDTIRLGSHSVSGASFLSVSKGFTFDSAPIAGILGLGSLSVTKAAFWQMFMSQMQFDAPQFSLFLNRSHSVSEFAQPGGSFVFGGVDESLYAGDVEFHNTSELWALNISAITVQGKPISINNKRVVFDLQEFFTGPQDDVAVLWSAVPGSKLAGSPNGHDSYIFPCDTTLNITLSFGGRTWPFNPLDFHTSHLNDTYCQGRIFGGAQSEWRAGPTFLNNVYSVFRQDPLSIGFAQLSTAAGGPALVSTTTSSSSPTSAANFGTPTKTGAPPESSSKKRLPIARIVGGIIGGLGCALLLAGLFFLQRRRGLRPRQKMTELSPSPFFHFLPTHPASQEKLVANNNSTNGTVASTSTAGEPLLNMKRAQMAALPRFGDQHNVPDVLVDTPRANSDAQGMAGPSTTSDPVVLQALEGLREEVRRLQQVADPPPGYQTNSGEMV